MNKNSEKIGENWYHCKNKEIIDEKTYRFES